MNLLKRLSRVYESAERVSFDDSSRIIIMSDCHRGDGSRADDFLHNEKIFISALNYYYNKGFTYIEIGDGDELWENKKLSDIITAHLDTFMLLRKFYLDERLYFIYGNHDMVKRSNKYVKSNMYSYFNKQEKKHFSLFNNIQIHEGLVLEYRSDNKLIDKKKILLIHGHQVDLLNSNFWKLSRFLVRYFWRPLELFGIDNPTSTAQNQEKGERTAKKLTEWVVRTNNMLIAGHNHRPKFPDIGEPLYFNDGSCVHPLLITGIEIDQGEIFLVKWEVKVNSEGVLYVGRDILAGSRKLSELFK
ncbi:MAG TPA: serine/threonine protein phosphatase [Clostridiales bacterium]|nr:serine/threonine protein phosphatase [Clostridiales bacterium]